MLKKAKSMLSEAKFVVDNALDVEKTPYEKKEIKIERNQLRDRRNNEHIREEHEERLRKFIGRVYLVSVVDVEEEFTEYEAAADEALEFLKYKDFKNYNIAIEKSTEARDIVTAKANESLEKIAEQIVASRPEGVSTFLTTIAASKQSFRSKENSYNTTRLAMQNLLNTEDTYGAFGSVITSQLRFNDNHMSEIMSKMTGNVKGAGGYDHLATVAIVDPSEPRNPYLNEYMNPLFTKLFIDKAVVLAKSGISSSALQFFHQISPRDDK